MEERVHSWKSRWSDVSLQIFAILPQDHLARVCYSPTTTAHWCRGTFAFHTAPRRHIVSYSWWCQGRRPGNFRVTSVKLSWIRLTLSPTCEYCQFRSVLCFKSTKLGISFRRRLWCWNVWGMCPNLCGALSDSFAKCINRLSVSPNFGIPSCWNIYIGKSCTAATIILIIFIEGKLNHLVCSNEMLDVIQPD